MDLWLKLLSCSTKCLCFGGFFVLFFILVLWHLYLPLSKIYEATVLAQKGCEQSKMGFYHLQQCSTVLSNNHYKV